MPSSPPEPVLGAVWIPLSRGKYVLVDEADAAWVNMWVWSYEEDSGYARRTATLSDKRRITVYLHRALLRAKRGDHVDHANQHKLDCRRANLRHATVQENNRNRPVQVNNASGVPGVNWDARRGAWRAYIVVDRKQQFLGYRDTIKEAIALRQEAERRCFGAFTPNAMSSDHE